MQASTDGKAEVEMRDGLRKEEEGGGGGGNREN